MAVVVPHNVLPDAGGNKRGNNPAAARLGNITEIIVNGLSFPRLPSFKKGTFPTLLHAQEAMKVKTFIENICKGTRGRMITGSPQRNRFEVILTPAENNLELWVQTDLRWDNAPMLSADLNANKKVIYSAVSDLYLTSGGQFGVLIQNSGGNSGLLKLGGGMPGTQGTFTGLRSNAAPDGTIYILPNDGTSGYFLKTDGAGNLSWAAGGGGGGMTSFDFSDGANSFSVEDGDTVEFTSADSSVTIDCSTADTIDLSASGGAPTDASYVVLGLNGSLSAERVLTAGTGVTITDGGVNSTVTIATAGIPNIDGGTPDSIYVVNQNADGGVPSSTF